MQTGLQLVLQVMDRSSVLKEIWFAQQFSHASDLHVTFNSRFMYIQKFKAFNILSEISQSIIVNDELLHVYSKV